MPFDKPRTGVPYSRAMALPPSFVPPCLPMLRTCSRIIALTAMVAGPSMTAQAAEPTGTLTLACKGTVTNTTMDDAKPEQFSQGIIVNFTARTVDGFGSPVKITDVDEVTVSFWGGPKTRT